ncbi:MAG: hypothetical protein R3178_10650 [Rhodothermales bacterium]|nr:hypothetical protein [Rhodothermales bacterium]
MSRAALISAALLLTAASVAISGVRLSSFGVQPKGEDFEITWQTDLEDGVTGFELHRRTSTTNNEFVLVGSRGSHGTGRLYSMLDDQIFKSSSEMIDYRLQAVLSDGSRQVLRIESVNYTPTAIRRTWGSIKAMF